MLQNYKPLPPQSESKKKEKEKQQGAHRYSPVLTAYYQYLGLFAPVSRALSDTEPRPILQYSSSYCYRMSLDWLREYKQYFSEDGPKPKRLKPSCRDCERDGYYRFSNADGVVAPRGPVPHGEVLRLCQFCAAFLHKDTCGSSYEGRVWCGYCSPSQR